MNAKHRNEIQDQGWTIDRIGIDNRWDFTINENRRISEFGVRPEVCIIDSDSQFQNSIIQNL